MISSSIVLIGFMGCGKSTVAGLLSKMTNIQWIDTDTWIEQQEARTVSQIFEQEGEAYFRRAETKALEECLKKYAEEDLEGIKGQEGLVGREGVNSPRIYSLGGGTPMTPGNQDLIRRLGKVFYLEMSPEEIYDRLKDDDTRPLLKSENPKERIRELLEKRKVTYKQIADYCVCAAAPPNQVAATILEKVRNH
jgi:shikimate dehydrogenase